jgi:hypothetical protein
MAQITFAEPEKPKETEPEWMYMKEELYAPYDSLSEKIITLPTIDAYKSKYIGQQVFFTKNYSGRIYSKRLGERQDLKILNDKYCEIIDILSANSNEYRKHEVDNSEYQYDNGIPFDWFGYEKDPKTRNNQGITSTDVRCDVPYFVMRETESGDTIYCAFKKLSHVMVGWFIKKQQLFVGNVFSKDYGETYYKCVNVVLDKDYNIIACLQNLENTADIQNVPLSNTWYKKFPEALTWGEAFSVAAGIRKTDNEYKDKTYLSFGDKYSKEGEWTSKEFYLDMERAKKQSDKKTAQASAQRKQQLTAKFGAATANRILNGETWIGMTKEMFIESVNFPELKERTVTANVSIEIWKNLGDVYYVFKNGKMSQKSTKPITIKSIAL